MAHSRARHTTLGDQRSTKRTIVNFPTLFFMSIETIQYNDPYGMTLVLESLYPTQQG